MARERTAAAAYYALPHAGRERRPSFKFKHYRDPDVREALGLLFDHKCAYCESPLSAVGARQVEHYRPKGEIDGEPDHSGYWWLAHDWDNLLPTCIDCNTRKNQVVISPSMSDEEIESALARRPKALHGKGIAFPLTSTGVRATCSSDNHDLENPLLLDPCRGTRNPEEELRWLTDRPWSIVTPGNDGTGPSPNGDATIKICALNRAGLIRDRTAWLKELRLQQEQILDDIAEAKRNPTASAVLINQANKRAKLMRRFQEKNQQYSAMAKALVDVFELKLRNLLAEGI